MPDYKAPLRDIHFVMNDLLDSEAHYASLNGCEEVTQELASAIIHEGARFAENTVLPMFRSNATNWSSWRNVKAAMSSPSIRTTRSVATALTSGTGSSA